LSTMRDLIAGLPEQLRWAAGLMPPEVPGAAEALVAGMGGSGMAGSVAGAVAAEAGGRVSVHKSYGLPAWAARAGVVLIAVSHSGNTEETLDCVEGARAAELPLAAVTTGGALGSMAHELNAPLIVTPAVPQPRAALGYLAGATLRLLESAGIVPPQAPGLLEAAETVERLIDGGRGPAVALAEDLAAALDNRMAVIYGGHGVGAVAAERWKDQINENAKAIAYWSTLPELDHNEVEGWAANPGLSRDRVGVVWLHDPGDHPRIGLRARITGRLMENVVGKAGEVHAQGEGVLSRLFSLIVVGDLVSVAMAERSGVDPVGVGVITALKRDLAREGL
jgi:glucose/mannose-6-phosphate isomerase